jgi:hypothetical protein
LNVRRVLLTLYSAMAKTITTTPSATITRERIVLDAIVAIRRERQHYTHTLYCVRICHFRSCQNKHMYITYDQMHICLTTCMHGLSL